MAVQGRLLVRLGHIGSTTLLLQRIYGWLVGWLAGWNEITVTSNNIQQQEAAHRGGTITFKEDANEVRASRGTDTSALPGGGQSRGKSAIHVHVPAQDPAQQRASGRGQPRREAQALQGQRLVVGERAGVRVAYYGVRGLPGGRHCGVPQGRAEAADAGRRVRQRRQAVLGGLDACLCCVS